jgi:RNA polymerase sigma-70 factor (ECF subfamily)
MNREITQESTLPQEDAALVKAFQAGNKASFDELVLRHKDRLFNLCFRFLGDYQEANDSAQEVFVKIYRSLKGFRLESAFSTWLYRIAVNTCKNKLRSSEYRHKKKMVHLDNPGPLEGSTGALEITDDTQSPLLELERKERLNLIRQAIDSLPPAQKMVVVLRDIEELSYDDIANITGYSLGTVKSRLSRARLDLRRKLVKVI